MTGSEFPSSSREIIEALYAKEADLKRIAKGGWNNTDVDFIKQCADLALSSVSEEQARRTEPSIETGVVEDESLMRADQVFDQALSLLRDDSEALARISRGDIRKEDDFRITALAHFALGKTSLYFQEELRRVSYTLRRIEEQDDARIQINTPELYEEMLKMRQRLPIGTRVTKKWAGAAVFEVTRITVSGDKVVAHITSADPLIRNFESDIISCLPDELTPFNE